MIPAVALAQTAPPQLVGIVVAPGYRAAVFATPSGNHETIAEGEAFGPYVVRSVRPDGVRIERGGIGTELQTRQPGVTDAGRTPDTGGVTFGLLVNPPAPAPD